MTKWHANVVLMAKHMNMVGGLGPLGYPLNLVLGVRAGKFLGVRRIFTRIFPILPKKVLGHFLCE